MSSLPSGRIAGRVSSALGYVAGGIGGGSRSRAERLLMLASVGWAFVAGGFAMLLGMMDYGPGVAAMSAIYLITGLVFGLANPRYWKLAAACAWGVVLMWATYTVMLFPLAAVLGDDLGDVAWGHELRKLVTMVILPLVGAFAGGGAGTWLRTTIAPRAMHALRRAPD